MWAHITRGPLEPGTSPTEGTVLRALPSTLPRCGHCGATGQPHPLARLMAPSLTHPHTLAPTRSLTHILPYLLTHTHTYVHTHLAHSCTHLLTHKRLLFGSRLPGTVDRGILNFKVLLHPVFERELG